MLEEEKAVALNQEGESRIHESISGTAKAWKIVEEVREIINNLPEKLRQEIVSVVLFGSLARGDFVPNVSDIDIFIVFKDRISKENIEKILRAIYSIGEKYRGYSKYDKVIDIPWMFESELPTKGSGKKTFFKFLSIYAFDFVKYSKVLYGRDIVNEIEVPNPRDLVIERAERLLKLLNKCESENDYYMIRIIAGETIRLAQIAYGEITIDKRKVLQNFLKYVPEYPMKHFAVEIWKEYLSPRSRISLEYIEMCKKFIRETLSLILNRKTSSVSYRSQ